METDDAVEELFELTDSNMAADEELGQELSDDLHASVDEFVTRVLDSMKVSD
ncbi:hypothetical protein [Alloscardovia omnicolens]|uniref:Uncharacterized protein n=1 Tax=Alloscardovia omnicolens F0580 TaxID=1321816 RepID=U1SCW3_9BIFI|nr:hypothetical protein [Alloscardovia omnicolens]ERH29758.1 hypothetical protein HMPREF9244_01558 [Alloscardovia omnicolens F0580]MDK6643109.1 hypothetical protein [Alloscardovia omnicolens]